VCRAAKGDHPWYIAKGGRVPDESTLKRRLKKFWTVFGPEAQDKAA
jgi:hypothetical protein